MESSPDSPVSDQVPQDYPSADMITSAASGTRSTRSTVQFEGFFFEDGLSPLDRSFRWSEFERLARIFVEKCRRNEKGKYAHLTHPEILVQYLERAIKLGWQTPPECRWMIRRTAKLLDWEVPASALEDPPLAA